MNNSKEIEDFEDTVAKGAPTGAKQDILDITDKYLNLFEDYWKGTPGQKEMEYIRMKLRLISEFASLDCPASVFVSILNREVEKLSTKYGGQRGTTFLPSFLMAKLDQEAKRQNRTTEDLVVEILSNGLRQNSKQQNGRGKDNQERCPDCNSTDHYGKCMVKGL